MKKLLTAIAFSFAAMGMFAQSPLWMRDVQLSPDGKEIVFCYKGDLYKVPANGGAAIRLTSQDSYECSPVWSPDSKQIAFASDRNGNFDVFIMSAEGEQPTVNDPFRRRTTDHLYPRWQVCIVYSRHTRPRKQCDVSHRSHE